MTSYKGVDVYAVVRERLGELLGLGHDRDHRLCELLCATIPTYTWVGLYRRRGDELVRSGEAGPPSRAPLRLPIGGDDGLPADLARTTMVRDLRETPRRAAYFESARAQLIVPIVRAGRLRGLIDIQSDQRNPFGVADTELLSLIADRLVDETVAE